MQSNIENTALKLNALLKVLSAVDGDNEQIMQEILIVLRIAQEYSEQLYCYIADGKEQK